MAQTLERNPSWMVKSTQEKEVSCVIIATKHFIIKVTLIDIRKVILVWNPICVTLVLKGLLIVINWKFIREDKLSVHLNEEDHHQTFHFFDELDINLRLLLVYFNHSICIVETLFVAANVFPFVNIYILIISFSSLVCIHHKVENHLQTSHTIYLKVLEFH